MITTFVLGIASLVCLGLDHFFRITDHRVLSLVFKGIASVFFVVLAFYSFFKCKDKDDKFKKLSRYVVMALCFSFAADVMLGLNEVEIMGEGAFIVGFLLFVAAHIMYLFAFSAYKKPDRVFYIKAAVLTVILICYAGLTPWFNFNGLFPLICIYSVIVSCVVFRSLDFTERDSLNAKIMAGGMILFVLSDMLLLFWIFPRDGVPKSVSSVIFIISNSCYYLGQLAAAHSISKSYS